MAVRPRTLKEFLLFAENNTVDGVGFIPGPEGTPGGATPIPFRQRGFTYGDNKPLITKRLPGVEENPEDKNFLRLLGDRAVDDTTRISQFLQTGEGISFLAKEAAIQRTNPQSIISPTNRVRLPANLIAQIPLTIAGTHVRRDGVLDTTFESNFNYDPERRGGKKYDTEFKSLRQLGVEDATSVNKAELDSNFTILGLLKNSFSDSNLILRKYGGGADSYYGIGKTTIQRYEHVPKGLAPEEIQKKAAKQTIQKELIRKTNERYGLGNPGVRKTYDSNTGSYIVKTDISRDQLNATPIYRRIVGAEDETKYHKDFIRFKIALIDPDNPLEDEMLLFRAFIENINDSFNGTWSSFKYNGRAEQFYTYSGFDREISFSFKIAPQSGVELRPLYDKLNYLVGSTAPTYKNRRMRGRYVRLSIGNWCNEIPGFFTNVGLNWTTSFPWDINPNGDEVPYTDSENSQHPLVLNVQCNFKPIHDFTPENRKDAPFIIPVRKKRPITPEVEPAEETIEQPDFIEPPEGGFVGPLSEDDLATIEAQARARMPMTYQHSRIDPDGSYDFGNYVIPEAVPSKANLEVNGIEYQGNVLDFTNKLAFINPNLTAELAYEEIYQEETQKYIENVLTPQPEEIRETSRPGLR